jgi:hypothetical protein
VPAKPKIIVKLKPYTMESRDINKKVSQALEAFESISYLPHTDEWNDTLMTKLRATQHKKRLMTSHMLFLALLVFILAGNIAFGLKMLGTDRRHSEQGARLETISNEFLINPISAKN